MPGCSNRQILSSTRLRLEGTLSLGYSETSRPFIASYADSYRTVPAIGNRDMVEGIAQVRLSPIYLACASASFVTRA